MYLKLLQLPFFLYAVFKNLIERIDLEHINQSTILAIILTLVLTPILFLLCLILAIYRYIVDNLLKLIYGNEYNSLMNGIDIVCANEKNCVPFIVVLVEWKKDPILLKEAVLNQFMKIINSKHKKFLYLRYTLLGYHFYLKSKSKNPKDYIITLSKTNGMLNREELAELLMDVDFIPMPFHNTGLFQIIIGQDPICYDLEPNNQSIYPVIYRIHHAVGDARSFLNILKGILADSMVEPMHREQLNGVERKNDSNNICFNLKDVYKKILNVMSNCRMESVGGLFKDRNNLRGYQLEHKKHFVWYMDDGFNYIDKIRKIRKTFNVSFLDVINAAGASGISYFYNKKISTNLPEYISAGVVLQPVATSFTNYGEGEFELENNFSAARFRYPIGAKLSPENSTVDRLKFLRNEYFTIKKSCELQFNLWFAQTLVTLLPYQIVKFLSKNLEVTLGVSSIPGCTETTFFGGCLVKDLIMMPPNSTGTGIHIVVYTYQHHLRISLAVDRSVIHNIKDVQELLNLWIYYIDDLYQKCSTENK